MHSDVFNTFQSRVRTYSRLPKKHGHHGVDMGNNPHFPPQHLYIPPIGGQAITSTSYMPHPGMLSSSNPVYTTPHPTLMGRGGQPGPMGGVAGGLMGGGLMGGYYHPSAPGGASSAPGGTGESPASGGSPSPGSEDSNDGSTGPRHNKRPSPDTGDVPSMGGAGGGSGGTGAGRGKKPKLSKKNKKKKDPNEPHKPVSAYALFFRDTQANIRGQNPNASFGEVSKIVASLWDSLDADNKNVYKKKTEAAKKEYLKALAAYRASLVSKGGEGDTKYPGGGQNFPPHYGQVYTGGQAYPGGLNPQMSQQQPPQQSLSHTSVPSQQLSPHATSPHLNPMMDGSSLLSPPMSQPMPPMPPQHPSMGGHGGPHGQAPPPGSYMAQQASPSVGSPSSSLASASTSPAPPHPLHHTPHSPHLYTQAQHSPPQQHLQQQQQYNQQHQQPLPSPEHHLQHHHQQQQQQSPSHHPNSSPTSGNCNNSTTASSPSSSNNINNNLSSLNDMTSTSSANSSPTTTNISTTMSVTATECSSGNSNGSSVGSNGNCIRSGCSNPAVQSSEWETEYCSNECVVNHCRDVFSTWVAGNQNSSSGYPAPVK